MATKFLALISVIGLTGICVMQAESPAPKESATVSPSPAKHRTHEKAKATASPAEKATSSLAAQSPTASPSEKRVDRRSERSQMPPEHGPVVPSTPQMPPEHGPIIPPKP